MLPYVHPNGTMLPIYMGDWSALRLSVLECLHWHCSWNAPNVVNATYLWLPIQVS